MKLAYLITAYNNPKHLNRLIAALDNVSVDFYIHIDKKSKYTFEIPKKKNVHYIQNNIQIYWGSFTFIDAVMRMLEQAKKNARYDYFCLISGTDYPVKSNNYILKFFDRNKGREFINICKMPENDKSYDRIEYFYYSDCILRFNPVDLYKILVNKFIRYFKIKRAFPKKYKHLIPFGGSNWWALSYECIEYLQEYVAQNPELTNFYRYTYIPEESFFHTIIGNSPFYSKVSTALTYTDWSAKTGPLPAPIQQSHLKVLSKETVDSNYGNRKLTILFARKFSDSSKDTLTEIDNTIRTNL